MQCMEYSNLTTQIFFFSLLSVTFRGHEAQLRFMHTRIKYNYYSLWFVSNKIILISEAVKH